MRGGGGRRCLGWRATEVRTGAGREVAPAGTPGDSGASRVGRGSSRPSARAPAPPSTACAPEPLSASRRGPAFPRRLLPAGGSRVAVFGFPLPSAAHSATPADLHLPGTRGPTPPRGRNPSELAAHPGTSGGAVPGRVSVSGEARLPPPIPPRAPASLAGFRPRECLLAVWSRWRRSLLVFAIDLKGQRGVGPGLPADTPSP